MVRSTLLVTTLLLAGCDMGPTSPPLARDAAPVTGSYIVTLKTAPEPAAPRMTIDRVASAAGARPRGLQDPHPVIPP